MSRHGMEQGSRTVNGGQSQEGLSQPEMRRMPQRNNWSFDSDELLVKLLLEECAGNKMCSGSFSPSVWGRICNAYINKTKEDITVQQLKSRWKTLKKLYRLYLSLVHKSGWSLDSDNHRPTPGCPTVSTRNTRLHEISLSPGSSTATGLYESHTGCGEYRDTPVVDVEESTDSSGSPVDNQVDKDTDPSQQAGMNVPSRDYASDSSKKKPVRNSSTTGTKRRSQEQTLEIVDKLADLSTRRSIIAEELKTKDEKWSYDICIDKLTSLPDITDEELFIGGKALRSRKERIFFLKMRSSAQSYWLRAHVKEWYDQV